VAPPWTTHQLVAVGELGDDALKKFVRVALIVGKATRPSHVRVVMAFKIETIALFF
jgi:hypothetical protein